MGTKGCDEREPRTGCQVLHRQRQQPEPPKRGDLFSDTWGGVGRDATTDLDRLAIDAAIARRHLADRFIG